MAVMEVLEVWVSLVDILSCSRSYRDRFIRPPAYLTGILTRAGQTDSSNISLDKLSITILKAY